MAETRNWQEMLDLSTRLLLERSGADVAAWNQRIAAQNPPDEASLRRWLTEQGVTGYAQSLLVMERFGYPAFYLASADELIDSQYADRPNLRPICDAVLASAAGLGALTIQARQTYISLLTPRRTFARLQPTTKTRLDIGLRLEGLAPAGRLAPSKIHATMRLQISLTSLAEVDDEVFHWLQQAYLQNS